MTYISPGSGNYLWHLTGIWEVHFEAAYYGICNILGHNFLGTERLADCRAHEKIPGHSVRQPKCYCIDYHYLEPGHPAPELRGRPSPPVWLLGNHWPSFIYQARSIGLAADNTRLEAIYRWGQLHGKWPLMNWAHGSHHRQSNRSSSPCYRYISIKAWIDGSHQSLTTVPEKEG